MCSSLTILLVGVSFNVPRPTAIYTLSLHDALPIYSAAFSTCRPHRRSKSGPNASTWPQALRSPWARDRSACGHVEAFGPDLDRKSTRLNSSHLGISYAVFCLKKKKLILNMSTTRDH